MKNNIKSWLCKTAAVLACASSAYAVPAQQDAIRYSVNGGAWVVINDNAVGLDGSSADNVINYTVNAGGWILSVSGTGFSIGTPGSPNMDLGAGGVTLGSGTLVVEYSQVDFQPVPNGDFLTTFHVSNTAVSSAEWTVADSSNTLFGGADLPIVGGIGPIGPFVNSPAAGGTSVGTFPGLTAPYAITIVESFTVAPRDNGGPVIGGISVDGRVTVPDGGNTLMLLGSALSILGLGAFRTTRKAVKA